MNTNHPTVVLCFVLHFTYCRLSIYSKDEKFAREVLAVAGVEQWLVADHSEEWLDLDTRVWFDITREALPKIIKQHLGNFLAETF